MNSYSKKSSTNGTSYVGASQYVSNDRSYSFPNPNEALNEYELNKEFQLHYNKQQQTSNYLTENDITEDSEIDFFNEVEDTLKGVGKTILDASNTRFGWIADDKQNSVIGLSSDASNNAIGLASVIADTSTQVECDISESNLEVASSIEQIGVGPVGELVSTTLGIVGQVAKKEDGITFSDDYNAVQEISLGYVDEDSKSSILGGMRYLFGNQTTNDEDSSSFKLFSKIRSSLSDAMKNVSTVFGVVSSLTSDGDVSNLSFDSMTTLVSGVLGNDMSSSFSYIGLELAKCGNGIGGSMQKMEEVAESGDNAKMIGLTNQNLSYTNGVRSVGKTIGQLNDASNGILSSMQLVGSISDSVMEATQTTSRKAVFNFGKLVSRMVSCFGHKPTPIESYVGMVTKMGTKGATEVVED